MIQALLPHLLTLGVTWVSGKFARPAARGVNKVTKRLSGGRTIAVTRGVQAVSVWTVLLTLLADPGWWTIIIPQIMELDLAWVFGARIAGIVTLGLTFVYEVLRRATTGPASS